LPKIVPNLVKEFRIIPSFVIMEPVPKVPTINFSIFYVFDPYASTSPRREVSRGFFYAAGYHNLEPCFFKV
jgi:hypothetical protein